MLVYHYTSAEKYQKICEERILKPLSKFNVKLPDADWDEYSKKFAFPLQKFYVCTLFEQRPKNWVEWGLLDLSLDGFNAGSLLLEINADDGLLSEAVVREHKFHSPKEYGFPPEVWKQREVRDSRPELRKNWYDSAVLFRDYTGDYVCPELLLPTEVRLEDIVVKTNMLFAK